MNKYSLARRETAGTDGYNWSTTLGGGIKQFWTELKEISRDWTTNALNATTTIWNDKFVQQQQPYQFEERWREGREVCGKPRKLELSLSILGFTRICYIAIIKLGALAEMPLVYFLPNLIIFLLEGFTCVPLKKDGHYL